MSASFETMLCSRPFTFLIGVDELPFVVHEAALADQSPALATLMRGKMSESLAGEVKWKDVDRTTFITFTQFAYTGDYSVPTMIVKASVQSVSLDEVVLAEAIQEVKMVEPDIGDTFDDWDSFGTSRKKKRKSSPKPTLRTPKPTPKTFKSLSYPRLRPRSDLTNTYNPTMSEGINEDISEVLFLHTSLYVLADKWGVKSLKRLTLLKLHQTLSMLRLDALKVHYIIELARYTYSDERTPDLNNGIDKLRELVCQFVIANSSLMTGDAMFTALIQEGGPLVRDLWRFMVPRVDTTG